MANHSKTGNETALMLPRHGEKGYIAWRIEVPEETKTEFVLLAQQEETTLKVQVNRALNQYLQSKKGDKIDN
jgi:hypothetical protein